MRDPLVIAEQVIQAPRERRREFMRAHGFDLVKDLARELANYRMRDLQAAEQAE